MGKAGKLGKTSHSTRNENFVRAHTNGAQSERGKWHRNRQKKKYIYIYMRGKNSFSRQCHSMVSSAPAAGHKSGDNGKLVVHAC